MTADHCAEVCNESPDGYAAARALGMGRGSFLKMFRELRQSAYIKRMPWVSLARFVRRWHYWEDVRSVCRELQLNRREAERLAARARHAGRELAERDWRKDSATWTAEETTRLAKLARDLNPEA